MYYYVYVSYIMYTSFSFWQIKSTFNILANLRELCLDQLLPGQKHVRQNILYIAGLGRGVSYGNPKISTLHANR